MKAKGTLTNDASYSDRKDFTVINFNMEELTEVVKRNGEPATLKTFYQCQIFNTTEDQVQRLKKGVSINVTGKLKAEAWTSRNQELKATLIINISEIQWNDLETTVYAQGPASVVDDLPF